jgi:hypothetical protein
MGAMNAIEIASKEEWNHLWLKSDSRFK